MDLGKIKQILDKISMPEEEETGVYKGVEVTLNQPFVSDDKDRLFGVYAKNSVGDVVLVRFMDRENADDIYNSDYISKTIEKYKCDIQKDMSTPSFWMCRAITDDGFSFADKALEHDFKHQVFFDFKNKTVKSVRDGVQEYFGAELGLEPYDRVFTVYRSPETITSIVSCMDKLPIIEDHIDPKITPEPEKVAGLIDDTEVIEYTEDFKDSTLFLRNKTVINEKGLDALSRGKRQLSLGYLGKLREHEQYDFEQYDLKPTHLAIVDKARGGDILSFEDKQKQKEQDMEFSFIDEDGKLSLQKVAELVGGLQEAIKNAPLDEVTKLLPQLQELMNSAKENSGMKSEEESQMSEESEESVDMESESSEEVESEDMGNHDEMIDEDSDEEEKESFEDSQAFADALAKGVDDKFKAIEKAKDFLDETYNFSDSSTFQIKKDAVEKHLGRSFEDSKVEGAFEALQLNNSEYKDFGDSAEDAWENAKKMEI